MSKKYNVAVVGATGAVGHEMVNMLTSRKFPINELRLFASARSLGKKMKAVGKQIQVEELNKENVSKLKGKVDVALFSAGGSISKEYAKLFTEQGIFVIDNSSAWRMDPEVPLVVPEVNSHALNANSKLIANPNCSTIQMVVVLAPLHKVSRIKRIIVSTYQSTSGAGGRAMQQLYDESKAVINNLSKFDSVIDVTPVDYKLKEGVVNRVLPYQIAYNLIPQIDMFTENLYTKEEMKMVNETRKILEDSQIQVSATCVRVPILRAHSETVWIELEKKISLQEVNKLLSSAPGVTVVDDPLNKKYPMPVDCANEQMTYVGRIREDISSSGNGLTMWIVSDNLLKGAALNAVEIAEALIKKQVI